MIKNKLSPTDFEKSVLKFADSIKENFFDLKALTCGDMREFLIVCDAVRSKFMLESEKSVDNAEESSIDIFSRKFWGLQQEAKANGVVSVTILLEDDVLADTEAKNVQMCGCGSCVALGMVEVAHRRLIRVLDGQDKD